MKNAAIKTHGADGRENGRLITIWNVLNNPELRPDQVYVTTVFPNERKGPHLHKKRRGLFCCVRGEVRIVVRAEDGQYLEFHSGDTHGHEVIHVAPGLPALIINESFSREAYVINMPLPAWDPADPDEWPVENWDYRG